MQIPPLPASLPTKPKQRLSRRKIEYYPLERELETHGGRDLHVLEDDWSQRKPLQDGNECGRRSSHDDSAVANLDGGIVCPHDTYFGFDLEVANTRHRLSHLTA